MSFAFRSRLLVVFLFPAVLLIGCAKNAADKSDTAVITPVVSVMPSEVSPVNLTPVVGVCGIIDGKTVDCNPDFFCGVLEDTDRPQCLPVDADQTCRMINCPTDNCIIQESFPARVTCDRGNNIDSGEDSTGDGTISTTVVPSGENPGSAATVSGGGADPRKPVGKGAFCGGIVGIACETGLTCVLDGNYPDAGGTCK
ncbi:MAG: hypothetical protein WCP97_04805 [bacterium]